MTTLALAFADPQRAQPNASGPVLRTQPVARAVSHPEGTALAMGALLRYANNTPDGSYFDKQVAMRLDKLRNGRAIAKRLVQRYEGLTAQARAIHFPGVLGSDNLKTRSLQAATFRTQAHATMTAGKYGPFIGNVASSTDTLPAETPQGTLTSLEVKYSGLVCNKSADPAGDKPAVYTSWIGHPKATDPYSVASKRFPSSGSLPAVTTGTVSTANAGTVWSSTNALGVTSDDAGPLLVTSVLMDDGTLDEQASDIALLIEMAEVFASVVPGADRMTPLKTGIDYTMGTLHISNPEKWSPKAVEARIVSLADLTGWSMTDAKSTSGIPWRFSQSLDARGSDYALFFNSPGATPLSKNVQVTIQSVTAGSASLDKENGKADFAATVSIGGPILEKEFAKDQNSVAPNWTLQRGMVMAPAKEVFITIQISERDAAPDVSSFSWGTTCTICGDYDKVQSGPLTCYYVGVCGPITNDVDINPKPDVGSGGWGSYTVRTLQLHLNLSTGAITGDVNGTKGSVITVTGDHPEKKATIKFKVDFS